MQRVRLEAANPLEEFSHDRLHHQIISSPSPHTGAASGHIGPRSALRGNRIYSSCCQHHPPRGASPPKAWEDAPPASIQGRSLLAAPGFQIDHVYGNAFKGLSQVSWKATTHTILRP